jgi:hypothetical protein
VLACLDDFSDFVAKFWNVPQRRKRRSFSVSSINERVVAVTARYLQYPRFFNRITLLEMEGKKQNI